MSGKVREFDHDWTVATLCSVCGYHMSRVFLDIFLILGHMRVSAIQTSLKTGHFSRGFIIAASY